MSDKGYFKSYGESSMQRKAKADAKEIYELKVSRLKIANLLADALIQITELESQLAHYLPIAQNTFDGIVTDATDE